MLVLPGAEMRAAAAAPVPGLAARHRHGASLAGALGHQIGERRVGKECRP